MKQSDNLLLQRLLSKTENSYPSELDKIIGFYKTILELERIKEPDISTYYPYPIHFKEDDKDVMLIDLPCNVGFTNAYINNKNLTFPQDLYIGLPIIRDDRSDQVIAFSQTVEYDDLKGYDPYTQLLPIRISSLTLDSRHIDELELTDEQISKIEEELANVKNISDLQSLTKRHFGENVKLGEELQLGLSSKNLALVQISSELKRLNSNIIENNYLLKNFLNHTAFDNQIENVSVDDLIPISKLDDSQKSVVAYALSNRFSVVTGAPGTGKTQVILNIIATALIKNKTVLVASKNNKAVDNVKERFDLIDSSHYLLRFGSREHIRNNTLQALLQLQTRIGDIQNQPDNLADLLAQHKSNTSTIKDARKKLLRLEELETKLPGLLSEKSATKSSIEEENKHYLSSYKAIRQRYSNVNHLAPVSLDTIVQISKRITLHRNSLCTKYSGLSRIWHNIFSKKKHIETFLGYIEDLTPAIKAELRNRHIYCNPNDFKTGQDIIEQSSQVILLLDTIISYKCELANEETRHSNTISTLNAKLDNITEEYNTLAQELETLRAQRSDLTDNISRSEDLLVNIGKQLVEAKIASIERGEGSTRKISAYSSHLPLQPGQHRNSLNLQSKDFLSVCKLTSVTSLSVKSAFPLENQLFDMLIIDEASQCDVASALPLILRAKQVVVIGDPKQLRHITSVKVSEENTIRKHLGLLDYPHLKYVEQSLWDYSASFVAFANENSAPITLMNHYRCHPDIIRYSNNYFYEPFLGYPLNVATDESKMTLSRRGVFMKDVQGSQKSDNININELEARTAISIAQDICNSNADVSVGIVTPFRDQANFIKSHIDDSIKDRIEVNTVYGFQGDEKDVIIYSLVVSINSPQRKVNWIDNMVPNLVNVAVTRARQRLYIIGNAEYIKSVSSEAKALGSLIRYAQFHSK